MALNYIEIKQTSVYLFITGNRLNQLHHRNAPALVMTFLRDRQHKNFLPRRILNDRIQCGKKEVESHKNYFSHISKT